MLPTEITDQIRDLSTSEIVEHCTKIAANINAITMSDTEEAANMAQLLRLMLEELQDRGVDLSSV